MSPFYSHSENKAGQPGSLAKHLHDVAARAMSFAERFGAGDDARLAALLHDLGKYGALFQRRLQHPHAVSRLDHWSIGAWVALSRYKLSGIASALCIQGHHIGLQQASEDALRALEPLQLNRHHPLGLRLTETDTTLLLSRLADDGIVLPQHVSSHYDYTSVARSPAAAMLDIRMLFSTLVDADFLSTESHFNTVRPEAPYSRPTPPDLLPQEALKTVTQYVSKLAANSAMDSAFANLRNELFGSCLEAGSRATGLFTLTAPTGSGKTLAMLAFALAHAHAHRLDRIIVVIPYLSIIEQTVSIYRRVFEGRFGHTYIIEDHSLKNAPGNNASTDTDDLHRRDSDLLAENWDAPIVVTTSVQFLESLFSNRPSACRKLHRLARSVILFDEIQTLPKELAIPTLATIVRLTERYGASVVFATATQPAFTHLDGALRRLNPTGWHPMEIAPTRVSEFRSHREPRIHFPPDDERISFEELGARLARHHQVLCVVNLKRHALQLLETLAGADTPLFHLSTNMCPAHRRATLDRLQRRLPTNQPCCLIATQCVEAGVDLDFPVVYRAMAPLDAIVQAAGRCNRHRLRDSGDVFVFMPAADEPLYPDSAYAQATDVTRLVIKQAKRQGSRISPEHISRYYRLLYEVADLCNAQSDLVDAIRRQDFAEVASQYRVIRTNTIRVVVPYDRDTYERLVQMAETTGLTREFIQHAQHHAVSIYSPRPDSAVRRYLLPVRSRRAPTEETNWFIYSEPSHYDPLKGLVTPDETCWIA